MVLVFCPRVDSDTQIHDIDDEGFKLPFDIPGKLILPGLYTIDQIRYFASDYAKTLADNKAFLRALEISDDEVEELDTVEKILYRLLLDEYVRLFNREEIDMDAFRLIRYEDMIGMGIPMGHALKIAAYIKLLNKDTVDLECAGAAAALSYIGMYLEMHGYKEVWLGYVDQR